MQPNYVKSAQDLIQDIRSTTKGEFYSNAIKHQIQLLWMQNPAVKTVLWLVLFINLLVPILVAVMPSDSTGGMSKMPLSIFLISLLPFVLFLFTAMYSAGLLIYGWRVARATRRQMMIIAQHETDLHPIEMAAVVGRASSRNEVWQLVGRYIETGNAILLKDEDSGRWRLRRVGTARTEADLRWYELSFLNDLLESDQQYLKKLSRLMTPERLRVSTVSKTAPGLLWDEIESYRTTHLIGLLNEKVRKQLINDGLFQPLHPRALWWQTFLFALLFGATPFALLFDQIALQLFFEGQTVYHLTGTGGMVIVIYLLGILTGAIWFLKTDIYTRFGLNKFIEIQGFALYLRVAMNDRLTSGVLSKSDELNFLPYAQTLGIVAIDKNDLFQRLTRGSR